MRYIVKHMTATARSKRMVWRVYDTVMASFPRRRPGLHLKEHYTDPATAQAEADKLNKELG